MPDFFTIPVSKDNNSCFQKLKIVLRNLKKNADKDLVHFSMDTDVNETLNRMEDGLASLDTNQPTIEISYNLPYALLQESITEHFAPPFLNEGMEYSFTTFLETVTKNKYFISPQDRQVVLSIIKDATDSKLSDEHFLELLELCKLPKIPAEDKDNQQDMDPTGIASKLPVNLSNLLISSGIFTEAKKYILLKWAIREDRLDVLKFALSNGADPNQKGNRGQFLLMTAILCKNFKALETLINAGANPSLRDEGEDTPLHYAAESNNYDMVNFLINACKVDVNTKNKGDQTPLHFALRNGKDGEKVVKLLIEKGANVNQEDANGENPVCCALTSGAPIEIVKFLIENGANKKSNQEMTSGNTLLHLAARTDAKNTDIVDTIEFLIAKNFINLDKEINVKNKNGCTALLLAVFHRKRNLVKFLLEKGANSACYKRITRCDSDNQNEYQSYIKEIQDELQREKKQKGKNSFAFSFSKKKPEQEKIKKEIEEKEEKDNNNHFCLIT